MTLVIMFGPPAVGKMTVGLELQRLTGFRLFHNHLTVDPVLRLFPFESPPYHRLVGEFRRRVFQEFAATDQPGLIFTFVWVLDDPQDHRLVDDAMNTFAKQGASTYFVELAATQAERLKRIDTPLRLREKPLLRDTAGARAFLLDADRQYQLNTQGTFFCPERHLKIDNTALEPGEAAARITKHFGLGSGTTG
jgi:hypothetical protein